MESNSVLAAFSGPIPSNPQVIILPFPHHSMLLLSNQSSDAKASTSNPHSLVSFLPNKSPWCSWTTEHSVKQPPTPSPFQTNRVPLNPFPARPQITRGVWRVESHNLWVSFSQNASGSLINIVHGSTDRVVGELRTLTLGKDAIGLLHTRFASLSWPCRSRSWPDLPSFPAQFDALEWG